MPNGALPQEIEMALRRFLEGDDQELNTLIHFYVRPLHHFLFGLTRDQQAAEDLAQETWLRVWKHRTRFDPKQNFKTWLYAIAKNAAYDLLRKKKSVPLSGLNETEERQVAAAPDPEPLPDELVLRSDSAAALERLLAQMTLPYRTLLILHYKEDLSLHEVAEVLEEPYNTIKSRHARAVRALRRLLGPASQTP